MSTIAILTEDERLAYDYPPILTAEARALCFCLTPELESKINRLRTSTNKVGFLLQYEVRPPFWSKWVVTPYFV